MKLFKDGFTLVLVPHRADNVIRITISRRGMVWGGAALALFLLFAVISIARTVGLRLDVNGYNSLRNDYLRQQVEIKRISNQIETFKDEMGRLRELDYKLRMMSNVEGDRPPPAQLAIGGIDDRAGQLLKDADLSKLDVLALLDKDLRRLDQAAQFQEESFNNLRGFLADQKDLIERTPYRWPVRGFLTSTFGERMDPFTGEGRIHEGIDIAAPKGSPVKSPADGIVTFSGWDPTFGNMLVVDHGYGVITRYGHNDTILVREGQRIKRGDSISTVGTTGRSTGPHLHYEIRVNDVAINPMSMIVD
jgi:murein DD-endopeptidase MepM/ murein hydrolase activator NlpD